MIYIKKIFEDIVQLGGQVATPQMIEDGWFEYEGPIPEGQNFKLIDGVIESYEPEIPPLEQIRIYKEYLNNTDFKMLTGYVPKEGEDLEAIKAKRDLAREYIRQNKPI